MSGKTLRRLTAAVLGGTLAGAGSLLYAREVETRWLEVCPVTVTLPRLAPEFDGYRVVQIGDVRMSFWGPVFLPPHSQRYSAGLYEVGNMLQYTNRGLGFVDARLRFLCRPEITVLTLRSPRANEP